MNIKANEIKFNCNDLLYVVEASYMPNIYLPHKILSVTIDDNNIIYNIIEPTRSIDYFKSVHQNDINNSNYLDDSAYIKGNKFWFTTKDMALNCFCFLIGKYAGECIKRAEEMWKN